MDNPFTTYSLEEHLERKKTADKNLRRDLLRELYTLYENQKDKRKKENWKRYVAWLKETRQKNTPESQATFKRNKRFIKEQDASEVAKRLWTLKTQDIPWAISEIKAGRTFGWLFWSCKNPQK